ncbi:MAG TPA: anti-sigma factor [Opitutaceae bacterium]|jgi:anti-sigma-K factor RskA|nr:anti-sigma factor [Opitutaceae bacterium]
MIDERTEELAALYAFDLLEGAELAAFEAALAQDAGLRTLVHELRESASALSLATPASAPPAWLKSRLFVSLAEKSSAEDQRITPFAPPAWIPWALAACLALTAAWLAQLYFTQKSESIALREQAALALMESQSVQNQLEAEHILASRQLADLQEQIKTNNDPSHLEITKLVSLLGHSSQARAIAVWNQATQQGVLTVEKLPALAGDQDYQLWVIDPKYPDPVSGGVFTVDAHTGTARIAFHPGQLIATAAKFAVSCERKGGRPKPEGPIVLLSD